MIVTQRPREKAMLYGIQTLSDQELLMLVLRHGNKTQDVSSIAQNVLLESNGLSKLNMMDMQDLMRIPGIKKAKALEVLAILELSKRVMRAENVNINVISHPEKLVKWLQAEIGGLMQECFLVVFLNVQHVMIHYEIIFKGTLDRSLIHPREIFNLAVKHHAAKFIAVHNHPGGSLVPSPVDIEVTKLLIEAGQLMQIELLDHLIVTKLGFTSIGSILMQKEDD